MSASRGASGLMPAALFAPGARETRPEPFDRSSTSESRLLSKTAATSASSDSGAVPFRHKAGQPPSLNHELSQLSMRDGPPNTNVTSSSIPVTSLVAQPRTPSPNYVVCSLQSTPNDSLVDDEEFADCLACGVRVNQKALLTHSRHCNGRYRCGMCKEGFLSGQALSSHIKDCLVVPTSPPKSNQHLEHNKQLRHSLPETDKQLSALPQQRPLLSKSLPILPRHRSRSVASAKEQPPVIDQYQTLPPLRKDSLPNQPDSNSQASIRKKDSLVLHVPPPGSSTPSVVILDPHEAAVRTHTNDEANKRATFRQRVQATSASKYVRLSNSSGEPGNDNDGFQPSDGERSDGERKHKSNQKDGGCLRTLFCPHYMASLCPDCARYSFQYPAQLKTHMQRKHGISACMGCFALYDTKEALMRHSCIKACGVSACLRRTAPIAGSTPSFCFPGCLTSSDDRWMALFDTLFEQLNNGIYRERPNAIKRAAETATPATVISQPGLMHSTPFVYNNGADPWALEDTERPSYDDHWSGSSSASGMNTGMQATPFASRPQFLPTVQTPTFNIHDQGLYQDLSPYRPISPQSKQYQTHATPQPTTTSLLPGPPLHEQSQDTLPTEPQNPSKSDGKKPVPPETERLQEEIQRLKRELQKYQQENTSLTHKIREADSVLKSGQRTATDLEAARAVMRDVSENVLPLKYGPGKHDPGKHDSAISMRFDERELDIIRDFEEEDDECDI